jgi:hypothetical protein
VVAVILVLGAVRSASRTKVWHDNDILLRQAVVDAPYSYHSHYMLGGWELQRRQLRDGEVEMKKALSLFPYDPALAFGLAVAYSSVGMCRPAIPLYRWSRELNPGAPRTISYATCLLEEGEYDAAKAEALEVIRTGGDLSVPRRVIFLADSAKAAGSNIRGGVQTSGAAATAEHGKPPESMQKTAPRTRFGTTN